MTKPFAFTLASTLIATAALSTGCVMKDGPDNDAIDRALPTSAQVQINMPGGAARTVGELASYYVITHDATTTFNGGTAWVLVLIHTIVQYPVTSVAGDVYTWGPWSNALDPAEYQLQVTANADGTFDYTLSGRSKTTAGATFIAVIQGHAAPGATDATGNGTFLLDFDAAAQVDPIDNANNKGTIAADYDLAARTLGLHIATTAANGSPEVADYLYNAGADGSGNMTFAALTDIGGGPALENLVIRSRWLATGAGRSDVEATGGDLGTTAVIVSQCWNTTFDEVYYTDNASFLPTDGDPTQCAFTDVDLP